MPKMSFKQFRKLMEAKTTSGPLFVSPPKDATICWFLSQETPDQFRFILDAHKYGSLSEIPLPSRKYAIACYKWFHTKGKSKDAFLPFILEMAKCPNRADWTKYRGGVAFRGTTRKAEDVKKMKLTGISTDNPNYFVGEGMYVSKFQAQSWSVSIGVAEEFATTGAKGCPIIYEINLDPNETLFDPDKQDDIIGYEYDWEKEVLRIGNKPTKVRMYVSMKWWEMWLKKLPYKGKDIGKKRYAALVKTVGKSNAQVFLKSGSNEIRSLLTAE